MYFADIFMISQKKKFVLSLVDPWTSLKLNNFVEHVLWLLYKDADRTL